MMEIWPMKYSTIFEEDMTQTIYKNYLGIFGWTEIWVATQPRTDRVIPLIGNGIFLREKILGFGQALE